MDDSWCVVGLTPYATADGQPHLDGAACAITPNGVVAVAEERMSRRSHQGGSELAMRAVLAAVGRSPAQVDRWILSTCGEAAQGAPATRSLGYATGASLADLGVPDDRVGWVPSHHLSHALTAAVHGTPGDLVLVADDAGTDLGPADGVERATAYVLDSCGYPIVLERVSSAEPGLGTSYRLAADRLGLNGYTECGKAMALAAYARFEPVLPGAADHPMLGPVDLLPAVELFATGDRAVSWRHRGRSWHDGHVVAARLAQAVVERGLVAWVDRLLRMVERLPVRLIWAGGLALNCRAIGLVAQSNPDLEVVVVPAPGDTGQALGNALYAARDLGFETPLEAGGFALGPAPSYNGALGVRGGDRCKLVGFLCRCGGRAGGRPSRGTL